jgi:hypothetical protein
MFVTVPIILVAKRLMLTFFVTNTHWLHVHFCTVQYPKCNTLYYIKSIYLYRGDGHHSMPALFLLLYKDNEYLFPPLST